MSNQIHLQGTEELINRLKQIDSTIRNDVAVRAVNAGGIQIENKAKINAPVLTGALRNSASTSARLNGSQAEAEIGFRGLKYARIQEFGGTITAKNVPYLKFKYKGHWVQKKQVTLKGKHYFEKAIKEASGTAVQAMAGVINSYLG